MLIHVVLEGFAAVDEDYGDFIVIEAAEMVVGIYINFLPFETGVALKLAQAFFDDFAQVASLARVNDDLSRLVHYGEL